MPRPRNPRAARALNAALSAGQFGPDPQIALAWSQLPGDSLRTPEAWHADPGALASEGAACLALLTDWLGPIELTRTAHDGRGGPDAEAEIDFRAAHAHGRITVSRLRDLANTFTITGTNRNAELSLIASTNSPLPLPTISPERLVHPWEVVEARHFPALAGRKVLVIGATGFIGARLVERLTEEGAQVTAVARDLRRAARIARCGVTLARPGAELAGCDAVINLAYDLAAPATANAAAAEALASAARSAGVAKFIHASSIAVYDGWPLENLTEASPKDGPGHDYKLGKRATERALEVIYAADPSALAILRFTNVYGPFSRLWTDEFAERLEAGPVIVPENALCNAVHVDDAVDAILAAAQPSAPGGSFIVTGPAPFLWSDLVAGYAEALGGTVALEPIRPVTTFAPAKRRLDPLSLARSPLIRPLIDQIRRRIGEDRLTRLRRRILRTLAHGKPAPFRIASLNPKLFAATATVQAENTLIAPRITLARALPACQAYLRWRYFTPGSRSGAHSPSPKA